MKRYTTEELEFIKQNYIQLGSKKCAEILHRPLSSVRQTANKKLNIKMPISQMSKFHSDTLIKKFKSAIPVSLFSLIRYPEQAYILGMLWAEGWIQNKNNYSINFKIIAEDFKQIKKVFFSLGRWKLYKIFPKPPRKPCIQLRLSGKEIVEFFIKNDFLTKNPRKILSLIPEQLKCYWFRGFFDGDGYICHKRPYRLSFSGPIEQNWDFLPKYFKIKKYIHPIKNHKSSRAEIYSKQEIKNFGKFMWETYPENKIGFSRKFKKFKQIN